ncbi:MAG: hypothetical protein ACYCTL_05000 [Acidimicrobiales bacterium]
MSLESQQPSSIIGPVTGTIVADVRGPQLTAAGARKAAEHSGPAHVTQ